jgi:predicted DNA-binding transcriptional regulator AlpA
MTKHERPWLEGAKAAVGETSQQVDPIAPAPAVTIHPEADEQPEVVTLAEALRELAAILPGLKAAIARPPVERLALRFDEVAAALGVSRRLLERERSAGRFPVADRTIGRVPLWKRETVAAYLDSRKRGSR